MNRMPGRHEREDGAAVDLTHTPAWRWSPRALHERHLACFASFPGSSIVFTPPLSIEP